MITINMQYFGGNGASSGKAGAGGAAVSPEEAKNGQLFQNIKSVLLNDNPKDDDYYRKPSVIENLLISAKPGESIVLTAESTHDFDFGQNGLKEVYTKQSSGEWKYTEFFKPKLSSGKTAEEYVMKKNKNTGGDSYKLVSSGVVSKTHHVLVDSNNLSYSLAELRPSKY